MGKGWLQTSCQHQKLVSGHTNLLSPFSTRIWWVGGGKPEGKDRSLGKSDLELFGILDKAGEKVRRSSGTNDVEYEDKQERKWGEQVVKCHVEFINQRKGGLGDTSQRTRRPTHKWSRHLKTTILCVKPQGVVVWCHVRWMGHWCPEIHPHLGLVSYLITWNED